MRITTAASVLFLQALQCLALDDSYFSLVRKDNSLCLKTKGDSCGSVRWTTNNRLLVSGQRKCLGAQGSTVGSVIGLYDCNGRSNMQKWECRNGTLLALQGQKLYMSFVDGQNLALSREPNSHMVIRGTTEGACSRTYRELYTLGGNAFGKICMFPFYFEDRWFDECTTFRSQINRAWCAVQTKYENELWGYCPTSSTRFWKQNVITKAYYQVNAQSTLNWTEAQTSCKQQGSELLSITDPQEQAYVTGLIDTENYRLWIGLIFGQEHGWQWSDGKPFRYLRWDSGQPLADPGNRCGMLDSSVQSYWKSSPCSRKFGYICYKGGSLPAPVEVEKGHCSRHWIPYNGHCFQLYRTPKSWPEAQVECGKEGGNLASISNVEDQGFIVSQLGYASTDELWIGLNDLKTEGLFEWRDQAIVAFTNWAMGEPSPSSNTENCVLIRGLNGNWADRSCRDKHGYICMKQSVIEPTEEEVEMDIGCKVGWKRHGSYCYFIGTETRTFDEAQSDCKSSGSYLADVSNGVDNSFLISLVGTRPEKHFWLGLSNQRHVEDFVWTNTNNVRFTHWGPDMPGHRQGCVAMTTGVLAGLWDLLPCANKTKYICKHLAEGALLTAVPPTVAPTRCSEGWAPIGSRNLCFKFFTGPRSEEKTWFEARDYCRAIGGDLLSIHSESHLRIGRHGRSWIGLSEPTPGAGYEWSDGSPLNYQHWKSGEPNNMNNVESCTEMWLYQWDQEGSWNDKHCESYNDWLCQIRAGVTPRAPPNDTAPEYNHTADNWMEWGGSQYYVNTELMAMEDARHFCQRRHGDLVVINSEAENVFLWKQVSKQYGNYYIGLTVDLDGSCGWMDDSPLVFQRWEEDQPNIQTHDENCATMTYFTGFWHNHNCGLEMKSICKRSASTKVNTTAAPTVAPKGGCPMDWLRFDSKCYRIVQNRQDKWDEARRRCKGMGGNLVSIISRSVQAFLLTRMAEAASTDLWIGLHSQERSEFFWTDGRSRPYANWGRKNRHHGPYFNRGWSEERCVVISNHPSIGLGKWIPKNCNDTNGYICLRSVDQQFPVSSDQVVPNTYVKLGNDSIKIITKNLTWDEAKTHCEGERGELVTIRNQWTHAYIELGALTHNSPLWIGLNKMETRGYFKYISGWPLSISNWAPEEPSPGMPCVYLDVDGTWKTDFCNKTMYSACMHTTEVRPTESEDFPGTCPVEVEDQNSDINFVWLPFRGHCYVFITHEIEWSDAASSCARHSGTLASIEDPDEQSFIAETIGAYKDGHTSFWIGLFKTHKGKWLWLDKAAVDYINWGEDDPDEEVFGQIHTSNGKWTTGARWHDRAYICKTLKVSYQDNAVPTGSYLGGSVEGRAHVSLAVVLIVIAVCALVAVALFLYKKSGRHLPTFENPLYFKGEHSDPDRVDTDKLIENTEEAEPEPIITV